MNINNDTDTVKIEFNENSTILDPEYHETRGMSLLKPNE